MPPGAVVPLLYAACCLIWGSTWLVIKVGLVGVPPFLGAGLRFLLASAVLFALARARRASFALDRDAKISVLSSGLLSFSFSYACVYWAEQHISSGLTAILYSTMPLMVALLSRFWTRAETLSARKVAGIVIAMGGTAALFWTGETVSRMQLAGMTAALLSVVGAAVNLVILKRHSRRCDIFVLNAFAMGLGAVCLLSTSAAVESGAALAWSAANVGAIVYLSLVGSVAAFLSYCHLVKVLDATPLSLITLIFPIVAVLLGRAVLGEAMSASTWVGMATVLAGVAVAVSPASRARP